MNHLKQIILGMDGILHGRCIYDDCTNIIECHLAPTFVDVLQNIIKIENNDEFIERYNNSPCDTIIRTSNWTVKISTLPVKKWQSQTHPFDIMLLAQNSFSMFIMSFYSSMNHIVNMLDFIKERIVEKRFCLIDKTFELSGAILHALDLIKNKWVMDDAILKDHSWIICKFENIVDKDFYTKHLRPNSHSIVKLDSTSVDTLTCPICMETIKPHNIVIQLSCGHVYHVFCNHVTKQSGFYSWIASNHDTCPMCRRKV